MRIDKVITYKEIGEVSEHLDSPQAMVRSALRRAFATGNAMALVPVLRDPIAMSRYALAVIPESRDLITPRAWPTMRRALFDYMTTRDARSQSMDEPARQAFYDVLSALLTAAGASRWETGLLGVRTIDWLTPRIVDLSRLVGESVVQEITIDSIDLPPGRRIAPSDVLKTLREGALLCAMAISRAANEQDIAQQVFMTVNSLIGADSARLDSAPYADLLSCANFQIAQLTLEPVPDAMQAAHISMHVGRIFKHLQSHPDLTIRSGSEFINMFKLRRYYTGLTRAVVASVLLRCADERTQPSTVAIRTRIEDGTQIVSAAPIPQGLGDIDRMVGALDVFASSVTESLSYALPEANPGRRLFAFYDQEERESGVMEAELDVLAQLLAVDVSYVGDVTNSMLTRYFTFKRDMMIEAWEDLVTQRGDGLVSTADPGVLLRLIEPWAGTGTYPVRRSAISKLATDNVVCLTPVDEAYLIDATRTATFAVSYPAYELTNAGLRATTLQTVPRTDYRLHLLLGLGRVPIDEHVIIIDSATLRRIEQNLGLVALYDRLTTAETATPDPLEVPWMLARATLPYWGLTGSVTAAEHADRARRTGDTVIFDSLQTLLVSDAVRKMYATAVDDYRVPFVLPRLPIEASAWYETGRGILEQVVPRILPVPDNFEQIIRRFLVDPVFRQLAIRKILRFGAEIDAKLGRPTT